MEQTFNKPFTVTTYDVADITSPQWRIVYNPKQRQMTIIRTPGIAARMKTSDNIVLSRRQAPRAFPEVFFNSKNGKTPPANQRTICLHVSPEQFTFLARFGNITAYLQRLIDRERNSQKTTKTT